MDSYCSQLDEISEAIASGNHNHPWCEPAISAEISAVAEKIHGAGWQFDPTKHPSEVVRLQIKEFDRSLAERMLEACQELKGRNQMSWYQVSKNVHRVFASTLDYNKGSLDSHLLEQSNDGRINDGFTLRRLMKKCTILHKSKTGISINCDSALAKIKYEFVPDGIQTYFTAYKAQLALFREHNVAYTLPEEYHCDRILTHLRLTNNEFLTASNRCLERIEDEKMSKTMADIETVFQATEENHGIGPDYHGTPLTGPLDAFAHLAKTPGAPGAPKAPRKDTGGKYPKGSCPIHKHSTNHLHKDCLVRQRRDNFICPFTGRKGLPDELVCPLCPVGWHPAELHDNPAYNPPRKRKGGRRNNVTQQQRQQQFDQQITSAKANLAHLTQWMPLPPGQPAHTQPPIRRATQPTAPASGSAMMVGNQTQTIQQLQQIQQQLMSHVQQQQHQVPSQHVQQAPATASANTATVRQLHPAGPNTRTLLQLGSDLHHIRSQLNTQRM